MIQLRRVTIYTIVNGVCLPANLGIARILTAYGFHYLLATICGYAAHCFLEFFPNRRFTFCKPEIKTRSGLFRAYLVRVGSFIIVLATTSGGVEFLKWDFLWSRILAALIAGIWDYCWDSKFTFKTKPFH